MSSVNNKVVLKHALKGLPKAHDFEVKAEPLPEPVDGMFRIRHLYIALDPWQRSAMAGRHATDSKPYGTGDTPPAEIIGIVEDSHHESFANGDYVRAMGGWQEFSLSNGDGAKLIKPDLAHTDAVPISTHLGVLGMPGLTAWASIVRLADVQPGQTVLVSAAHGPVGSMVGQIAIKKGATAVGIAGSDEKCQMVTEKLGFSACVNYKASGYPESLRKALPNGADIYHDNVGGQMLIDAINVMNEYGTVVLCGLISQYNDPALAVDLPLALPIMKRLTMKGLVVYDHADAEDEFVSTVAPWINDGSVRYLEDIAVGLDSAGAQFAKLMRGDNIGKTLIKLNP